MQRLISMLDGISRTTGTLVRWLALAMLIAQFLIVIARFVFGYSSIAAQESVLYMHATLFMLGAGYTLLQDGHVRVDIFYDKLGQRGKDRIDLFGHLFLLTPAMLMLLYWSWPAVSNSWKILEGPISVGGIKAVFLLKSLIPAFCILVLLQSLSCVLRILLKTETRDG
ncbi:TRAP transporter small permease subunit [Pseudophaeobacter flagellatus]|uniref:TRAP transporter small permease subunit n=1 Tax=Pseudophaeobacter flagellatus TaxID=2899119 RepID=UPI001E4D88A9|nr:TRAP transporter small permease subunit [Pseudophaeobacter flagellatus]MCD9149694.1 TRAP transporter small permease subunit [Pseudophaeobacter flagellatus]